MGRQGNNMWLKMDGGGADAMMFLAASVMVYFLAIRFLLQKFCCKVEFQRA
jgi:hypothetical protein